MAGRSDTDEDTAPAAKSSKSSTDEAPVCPRCGAPDENPSYEVLGHCWRCGYTAREDDGQIKTGGDAWPPADLEARRTATHMRRLGLPAGA